MRPSHGMRLAPVCAEDDDMQERSIVERVMIPETNVEAVEPAPDRVAGGLRGVGNPALEWHEVRLRAIPFI